MEALVILLSHSPLFTLTARHCKVQLSLCEFIGALFIIFNTLVHLNTFSQEKEESGLINAVKINSSPASLTL